MKDRSNTHKSMPSDPNDWRAYFMSKFSAPSPSIARPHTERLESVLSNSSYPDFTVSVSDVTTNAFRLKKKNYAELTVCVHFTLKMVFVFFFEMLALLRTRSYSLSVLYPMFSVQSN